MSRLALIPARAGSKRLPGKNTIEIKGKPLISYTVETVLESGCFSEIIISTDDPVIREIGESYPGVQVVDRPPEFASDTATVSQVMQHLANERKNTGINDELYGVFLPTVPFRTVKDIKAGLALLDMQVDSVISVAKYIVPPQFAMRIEEDGILNMVSSDSPLLRGDTRRQQQEILYYQNGAFFLGWVSSFLKYGSFFLGKVRAYVMPETRSVDIDTIFDLLVAKSVLTEHDDFTENHE